MNKVRTHYILYFIMASVWVYMIWAGSMEIAVRNYGPQYGLTIVGSVCGTLVLYQLAAWLENHAGVLGNFLQKAGENTVYILIIHTWLNGTISRFVRWLGLGPGYAYHLFAVILIHLALALLAAEGIRRVRKMVKA